MDSLSHLTRNRIKDLDWILCAAIDQKNVMQNLFSLQPRQVHYTCWLLNQMYNWFGHYRLIIDYHMLSDLNHAGIYFTTLSAENYVQLVSRIKSVKDKVKENKFC